MQHRFPPIEANNSLQADESSGRSEVIGSTDSSTIPEKVQKVENNGSYAVQNFAINNKAIKDSAVSFTLNFHKKANFSRQDVRDVQQATQVICSKFADGIQSLNVTTDDPDINYCFERYTSSMKIIFQFIDSDYKFFLIIERNRVI